MSPVLHLNGIDLHYEEGGAGPALLLSHGYSSTGEMWQPQRAAFEGSHRIVTWDMRGHGSTESPADPAAYSAEQTVEDMRCLLDRLEIDRAVVGGLSLGGYMSLRFYGRHPQRVRALVIADSGPGYRNPEARAQWNASAEARAKELEEKGLDSLASSTPERRQAIRRHRSPEGLALAARGMLAQFDSAVIDSLPQVAVPTLILVGSEDRPFLAPSEYMAKKIPGARLEVVEGAGHAANMDQPERFNEALRRFLDDVC